MIRITKHLYINILTVALFVVCAIIHSVRLLCITYAVMFLHEMAHTLAALLIGLKISHIVFQPFGVNLKLKNKMVYSLADEIILYISGPLCNIILAFSTALIYRYYPIRELRLFYISNMMLFVMNMLPAVPLDGGIIVRKILMYRFGYKTAQKIMMVISAVIAAVVMLFGAIILYRTRFNFSVLLFSLLILGNIFTQKEKYNIDFVKELMFHSKKNTNKIHHIIAEENTDYNNIAEKFKPNSYNVIYMTDSGGKIKNILTETQVINKLTDTNITV